MKKKEMSMSDQLLCGRLSPYKVSDEDLLHIHKADLLHIHKAVCIYGCVAWCIADKELERRRKEKELRTPRGDFPAKDTECPSQK